ncbi:integral membrane sensor signal transduction histidine kinase [Pseudodesulfovibrio mercurii]|uniref:histidine kinase n=1 Tax=Pseudodesulfovibrio mercurii TaxID=641491 RepID=F0JKB9_9BACT|nr:HAMP domain-containing sensor histidine kinase [Pseudodesulfovibrio mercurii]EGB16368.1 integral membrane sensor signal transduction histidine kinase [Pseudodesulfovibrio mercurii]
MAESGRRDHTARIPPGGLRWLILLGRRHGPHSYPLLGILCLAVLCAVALPLINALVIYPTYTKIMIGTFEDSARRLAVLTIPPSIKHARLGPAVLDTPRFLADVYRLETDFGLLKVRVLAPDGMILYSTETAEIDTVESGPEFRDVVAKGRRYARLGVLHSEPVLGRTTTIDTVAAFVPLMRGNDFLGAFELVFDVTGPKRELERFNLYATAGSFVISFALLGVVLVLIRQEAAKEHSRHQAEKLREDVEQITRHDIKTPLLGVLSGITYLENFTDLDADQREMLDDMRRAANTGMELISRSLDLYKMETGTYEYLPGEVDVLSVCRRVTNDLSGLARRAGVIMETRFEDKPLAREEVLVLSTEENLFYAVLANLVKNSVEASGLGDKVSVHLRADAGKGEFSAAVHNPAPVPESVRANFFDKYATAGKRTGTGLGTYSARLMVEVMGGRIHMDSSEERGTTVTVTLPLKPRT